MDYHKHARLTVYSREALAKKVLQDEWTLKLAAASFNVSAKTAAKWVRRYREQGVARSAEPKFPAATAAGADRPGQGRAGGEPAPPALDRAPDRPTDRSVPCHGEWLLRRMQISRTRDLELGAPVQRYEHEHPGDLLHLDIKKLVRIARPSHRVTGNPRDTVRGIGAGPTMDPQSLQPKCKLLQVNGRDD